MSLPGGRLEGAALALLRSTGREGAALAVDCNPDGFQGARWSRYAGNGVEATEWPSIGSAFGAGLLKLNKARDANLLALEALRSRLQPDAPVVLFGGNDEGIKSVRQIGSVSFEVVDSLGHGRLLRGSCGDAPRKGLEDFARDAKIALPASGERRWTSFPGCFAQGGLDAGTALLLGTLGNLQVAPGRVLDFACGTGVIAADVLARWPESLVFGCDHDAVAVAAARRNVPRGKFVVGDGLGCVDGGNFDLVVSNPPFHDGKVRSHRVWMNFVADVRRLIRPEGELRLVVQREVPVEGLLRGTFKAVERLLQHPRFNVWSAR